MIRTIKHFLATSSMYRLMLYYLTGLLIGGIISSLAGWLSYTWWHLLGDFLVIRAAAYAVNSLCARLFRVPRHGDSEAVTSLILALIMGPLNPLLWGNILILIAASGIAQASKYLIAIGQRHVFNPAALAAVAVGLIFNHSASWWVGASALLPIILIGGLVILRKLRWVHLSLSFMLSYLVLLVSGLMMLGLTFRQAVNLDYLALLGVPLFFASVMLVEPLTAPSRRRNRIMYGIFVALVYVLLNNYSSIGFTLELSLLCGNLVFWFTKSGQKIRLKFVEKFQETPGIYNFWFQPVRPFNFIPGQFLEWSLYHPQPDNRGVRRWFTIASSPTEDRVLLATKIFEPSSSFKKSLLELNPGEEISVSDPDGDFVLPSDPNQKLVFIAGGIGITPFRSIIKYLIDNKLSRDIVVAYTAKTAGEFAYESLLDTAQSLGIKPVFIETQKSGFLTAETIKEKIPDWNNRTYYISGPEPMVKAYQKLLRASHVPRNRIKTDFFPGYEN